MDALFAEIKRKRKDAEDVLQTHKNAKFFKRSDLEVVRVEKEKEKEREKEKEKEKLLHNSVKKESHHGSNAKIVAEHPDEEQVLDVNGQKMTDLEVIKRLRMRHEPIRLFGETNSDVRKRLRQIEILAPEIIEERQRNDFMVHLQNVEDELLDETLGNEKKETEHVAESLEDMQYIVAHLEKNDDDAPKYIRKFLKWLLKVWEQDLNKRSDGVKRSNEGKNASATFKQTQDYLDPLLKQSKNRQLTPEIQHALCEIIVCMFKREYIQASDIYYRMAIGNAPWPIGVTNVGIHSRTGREKIFAQHIAHVLNDETQRKYIQGLKRLMTYCQNKFEADPSKCMEYKGVIPAGIEH